MEGLALIDPRLSRAISTALKQHGLEPIAIPLCSRVADPIAGHPDIQLFLSGRNCFVHPEMPRDFLKKIAPFLEIVQGDSYLGRNYPEDIAYNVAQVGGVAFHKSAKTDCKIISFFQKNGVELVDVPQGYSRCSTVIVDDSSIITADVKIDRAARERGLNSLKIDPGHVELPGYRYGFLGGATGHHGKYVFFTGHLNHHPNEKEIIEFIKSRGKEPVFLSNEKVVDGGSIEIVPRF